jgi:hypothetical protein
MQSSNYQEAVKARDTYESQSEKDAFEAGYNHAHGIACHNVPRVGEEYWTESEGRITPETPEEARDLHASLCYDAEMNARCYSPWEFVAHEINSLDGFEAESAWEAYDAGVTLAIAHDLADYTDSDYLGD